MQKQTRRSSLTSLKTSAVKTLWEKTSASREKSVNSRFAKRYARKQKNFCHPLGTPFSFTQSGEESFLTMALGGQAAVIAHDEVQPVAS
jgi:hypothetical protein